MKKTGFTLIELLVTVSIFLTLLFIGIPSFKDMIDNSRIVSSSNEVLGAFNYARMEAVKRGNTVHLGQRNGTWASGLVVWVDADADDTMDPGEELRLWEPLSRENTLVSANTITSFVFQATGAVDNADQLTICDNRSGEKGQTISILISGTIFAEKVTCV
ncbi:GspH/FimT family pseudopilin [Psychromonas sp.]|uniref:GspH/FimT family pseudopilin n=1 Tax=Psychromonas sp. TaxID=1884585 RepID=UPI0039E21E9C